MSQLAPPLPLLGTQAGFRRFSVPEYHKLIEIGVLTEDDSLELLEGYLVHKMARHPPHDRVLQRSNRRFMGMLPPTWDLRIQSAITLPDSEPEPDIALVGGTIPPTNIVTLALQISACSRKFPTRRLPATVPTEAASTPAPTVTSIAVNDLLP
jgi:hypothetical protein